jgi:hypothetical protein
VEEALLLVLVEQLEQLLLVDFMEVEVEVQILQLPQTLPQVGKAQ